MDAHKCSKNDGKAKRLIKMHSHMVVSLDSYNATKALGNVLQGIYDLQRLVEGIASKRNPRQKSTAGIRSDLANRISLTAQGFDQYCDHRLKQIEAFSCCVESFGFKNTDVRSDIKALERDVLEKKELLKRIIIDSNDGSVTDNQILEHAKSLQNDKHLTTINELSWTIGRKLREETDGIILQCMSSNDDFVSKVAKNLHASAGEDPVSLGLQ